MTTAAVIGSGPNGLAAAITLAAAGVSVTVYEAGDRVGGGARSSELTLPGLVHDDCSSHHPFGLASEFARTFPLEQHGLEWAYTDVEFSHPLDGGRGAHAVRSVVETSRTLGADAERYRRFFSPVASRMPTVADEFLQSLIHRPRHPFHLATLGARAALPAASVARYFRTEEALRPVVWESQRTPSAHSTHRSLRRSARLLPRPLTTSAGRWQSVGRVGSPRRWSRSFCPLAGGSRPDGGSRTFGSWATRMCSLTSCSTPAPPRRPASRAAHCRCVRCGVWNGGRTGRPRSNSHWPWTAGSRGPTNRPGVPEPSISRGHTRRRPSRRANIPRSDA